MKKLTLVFVLLVGCITRASSQFHSGYLVTNDQDTVRGFLKEQNNAGPIQCLFKATKESAEKEFMASEIKEFAYNGGFRYVSNQQGSKVDTLETKFIQILISGVISIYRDGGKYYVVKAGTAFPVEDKNTGTIRRIMLDCPKVSKRVRKLLHNDIFLIDLYRDYNSKCFEEVPTEFYYPDIFLKKTLIGVFFEFHSTWAEINRVNDIGHDPGWQLGISLAKYIPTPRNRFIISTNLVYSQQRFYSFEESADRRNNPQYLESEARLKAGSIEFGLKYLYSYKNLTFFLHAGGGLDLPISISSSIIVETQYNNFIDTTFDTLVNGTQPGYNGFVGVGFYFLKKGLPKLGLELKYQMGNGMGEIGRTTSTGIGIHYILTGKKKNKY